MKVGWRTREIRGRFARDLPAGLSPRPASSRRTKLRRTDDKGLPCPPFSRQPFASSSPCAQGRDAESHPTPRGKRHIASLSGRPAFTSDALSCPLRPNDAGRPDRRGTSSGGHRPSNPATRQLSILVQSKEAKPEAERVFPSHQDVGRFLCGATGNTPAVGLAAMFLPPGYQRDSTCAYSLTRARPGSYRDRIKPSVCATPAPCRHATHLVPQMGGEVCPASRAHLPSGT